MLSYRLGTVNDFHWEFKPVFSYSNITLSNMFVKYEYVHVCNYVYICVWAGGC